MENSPGELVPALKATVAAARRDINTFIAAEDHGLDGDLAIGLRPLRYHRARRISVSFYRGICKLFIRSQVIFKFHVGLR